MFFSNQPGFLEGCTCFIYFFHNNNGVYFLQSRKWTPPSFSPSLWCGFMAVEEPRPLSQNFWIHAALSEQEGSSVWLQLIESGRLPHLDPPLAALWEITAGRLWLLASAESSYIYLKFQNSLFLLTNVWTLFKFTPASLSQKLVLNQWWLIGLFPCSNRWWLIQLRLRTRRPTLLRSVWRGPKLWSRSPLHGESSDYF